MLGTLPTSVKLYLIKFTLVLVAWVTLTVAHTNKLQTAEGKVL